MGRGEISLILMIDVISSKKTWKTEIAHIPN